MLKLGLVWYEQAVRPLPRVPERAQKGDVSTANNTATNRRVNNVLRGRLLRGAGGRACGSFCSYALC